MTMTSLYTGFVETKIKINVRICSMEIETLSNDLLIVV
jgi:hypothetical protein